jgi:predicted ATPase
MEQSAKPCLRVTGLHIEGLKALRRVDWPADGMGWHGQVPDMVMVGGVNGSGKTTLLELIADAARVLRGDGGAFWEHLRDGNAWIDLRLVADASGDANYRIVFGDPPFVRANATDSCTFFARTPGGWQVQYYGDLYTRIHDTIGQQHPFAASNTPRVLYLPTDRRLEIPDESFKSAGDVEDTEGFYYRFRAAKEWKDSLGALLYGARWADLNAKEEGHPEKATHFESYAKAFQVFFGEAKRLVWSEGKLFVKIADTGALHPLMELSSGEKQALILAAELYRRWRPGSLILIDEPELHFHPTWQAALWGMLEKWQKERGGQVIVATQSNHLFGIADPGTTVLLGEVSP